MNTLAAPAPADHALPVRLLLNIAHALDHMFLLIFAAAVGTIAADFGFARWEDLMPYGVGAFVLFGIGSLPAGRLGDLWGRRNMMLAFFFGIGCAALLAGLAQNVWQLAVALGIVGAFGSIYHPVGIPMLVQHTDRPGIAIAVNGLAGNLGVAVAALTTGFLVKWFGWRAAFALPGLLAFGAGIAFARSCPREHEAPARRAPSAQSALPTALVARVLVVVTIAAISGGLLFNFTTNGNGRLLAERFQGSIEDPGTLGLLLAVVYALASFAQLAVGRLLDRVPLKPLFLLIVLAQVPLLVLVAFAQGWWLFVALLAMMGFVFAAIPFNDVLIVRYVDDRYRSRVAGARLTVSLGISSLAVWALGPVVKGAGFHSLLLGLAGLSACTALAVCLLPRAQPA